MFSLLSSLRFSPNLYVFTLSFALLQNLLINLLNFLLPSFLAFRFFREISQLCFSLSCRCPSLFENESCDSSLETSFSRNFFSRKFFLPFISFLFLSSFSVTIPYPTVPCWYVITRSELTQLQLLSSCVFYSNLCLFQIPLHTSFVHLQGTCPSADTCCSVGITPFSFPPLSC